MKRVLLNKWMIKRLFLVVASLIVLILLVACKEKPSVSPPVDEQAIPSVEEPATSEELPGATDFTDVETSPAIGAVLGSPAYDMFLKIEGVPGESTDSKHKEWIEILSFSHGVSQPTSGSASSGGATTAERASHQDFIVVKTLDKASPKLALFCCNGQHIREVIIECCRAEGDKLRFMMYKLEDVIISSVQAGGSAGDQVPTEQISLNYQKISWTYTEIDPATGVPKGEIEAHWDLVANRGG